jgi:HK97 family phage major capsid protein
MPTTTTKVQELKNERARIWEQMKDVMAEADKSGWSSELDAKYERLSADLDAKGNEADRLEAHGKLEEQFSQVDRSGVVPKDDQPSGDEHFGKGYDQAFARYMRVGTEGLDVEDKQILRGGFQQFDPKAAAGVATGAAGGFTVPPAFRQKIVTRLQFIASMRQLAEVITTETGAKLPWPTVDDTANEGAILGENTQVTEQDVVLGQADLDAYMYTSKLIRASFQLLNDSAFDLDTWLANILATRIGRIQNRHYTIGTGVNQPDGLFTSATVGKTAASATVVTYDELVDLTESIDPAYTEGGNCGFVMSQAARGGMRKLKDGQQRPLWEPSVQAGTPDRFMGYGLTINNYVPIPAANATSIGFGDVREAYVIRDVTDFTLLRLTERYADFLQVGFLGFQRSDGTLQNAAAFKTLKQSA